MPITTREVALAGIGSGAEVVELEVPFSDPETLVKLARDKQPFDGNEIEGNSTRDEPEWICKYQPQRGGIR